MDSRNDSNNKKLGSSELDDDIDLFAELDDSNQPVINHFNLDYIQDFNINNLKGLEELRDAYTSSTNPSAVKIEHLLSSIISLVNEASHVTHSQGHFQTSSLKRYPEFIKLVSDDYQATKKQHAEVEDQNPEKEILRDALSFAENYLNHFLIKLKRLGDPELSKSIKNLESNFKGASSNMHRPK